MSEVSCAMNYIGNFVTPDASLPDAQLSVADKNIITKAVDTIDNWNVLCEQGVSIALTNNTDVQYLKAANHDLKSKTNQLKSLTSNLKTKLLALQNV